MKFCEKFAFVSKLIKRIILKSRAGQVGFLENCHKI